MKATAILPLANRPNKKTKAMCISKFSLNNVPAIAKVEKKNVIKTTLFLPFLLALRGKTTAKIAQPAK